MSLSIGEIVYMKHPETKEPNYFVVFKIDGTGVIHFTPHHDAGRAKKTDKYPAREDLGGGLSAGQLQMLGVEDGKGPEKRWVSPLGDWSVLNRD